MQGYPKFMRGIGNKARLHLVNKRRQQTPVSFNATAYRDSEGIIRGTFATARNMQKTA